MVSYGSSPRVWGKETLTQKTVFNQRIIPTGVGKSGSRSELSVGNADHPHGCGEKDNIPKITKRGCGSSPRVWGKVKEHLSCQKSFRIIPTGVGKSQNRRIPLYRRPDHPHGCGEKKDNIVAPIKILGSSPRVWGKVSAPSYETAYEWIIPTGVGKSVRCHR